MRMTLTEGGVLLEYTFEEEESFLRELNKGKDPKAVVGGYKV